MLALGIGFGFWWIYFDVVGRRLPRQDGRSLANWLLSHLPITLSIAAAGAGMTSLIVHAHDASTPESTAWLVSGSVALGLLALIVIERALRRCRAPRRRLSTAGPGHRRRSGGSARRGLASTGTVAPRPIAGGDPLDPLGLRGLPLPGRRRLGGGSVARRLSSRARRGAPRQRAGLGTVDAGGGPDKSASPARAPQTQGPAGEGISRRQWRP